VPVPSASGDDRVPARERQRAPRPPQPAETTTSAGVANGSPLGGGDDVRERAKADVSMAARRDDGLRGGKGRRVASSMRRQDWLVPAPPSVPFSGTSPPQGGRGAQVAMLALPHHAAQSALCRHHTLGPSSRARRSREMQVLGPIRCQSEGSRSAASAFRSANISSRSPPYSAGWVLAPPPARIFARSRENSV
jgi:hypothetical protein